MTPPRPRLRALALGTAAIAATSAITAACSAIGGEARPGAPRTVGPELLAALWVEPEDVASRDLFWGPGGKRQQPDAAAEHRFLELDDRGFSDGYEVEAPDGRQWKVKVGREAQSELVASRVLWAIGYHQPVTYYLPRWKMRGGPPASGNRRSLAPVSTPPPGRFRLESDHDKEGSWSFRDNPFVGTRELHGLLVANLVLNNWDLDPDNNRIYEPKKKAGGGARRYVMQDLGAALGRSVYPFGSRNAVDDFERQQLVLGMRGGRVRFDHRSLHSGLYEDVTAADVVWACELLGRLSDEQWKDAFRAADYPPEIAARYVRQIRRKIEQGRALAPPSGARS